MAREWIVLNGEKVRHRIAAAGIPRKQLLVGMSPRTLTRILAGEKTSLPTAMRLAQELNVTLEDLTGKIKESDMATLLPTHWLY